MNDQPTDRVNVRVWEYRGETTTHAVSTDGHPACDRPKGVRLESHPGHLIPIDLIGCWRCRRKMKYFARMS